jgi:hypothetical protein
MLDESTDFVWLQQLRHPHRVYRLRTPDHPTNLSRMYGLTPDAAVMRDARVWSRKQFISLVLFRLGVSVF